MIPIRLELKNFMSYGEQVMPLDFRGMHLACLSGDNGHGKSALLDAITWALWGEARGSADELIRLGTEEMRVTFDFEVEGDLYRVVRGRSKRHAGNMWEVYISDAPDSFRPITGQGIRDTGKVIQRVLRMDYRTFINSAYIQQGRADEFTKQTVGDRKKILSEILDLSRYDALEQKAKDRRNAADLQAQELDREISRIENELAGEEESKTELAQSVEERKSLDVRITAVEARLAELQVRHSELESGANRVREMERQVSAWRQEIERFISQKADQEKRVARGREILKDRARILSGYDKLRATRESASLLDRRLEELRRLEHDKAVLGQQVLVEKHKLDLQRQSLIKELSDIEGRVQGSESIKADAERLRTQVARLDGIEAERVRLQLEVTAQADHLGELKAQHEQVMKLLPELEEKLKMISQPGAKCPLCQTELGHQKHDMVVADYQRQIAEVKSRIVQLKRDGSAAKGKRDDAQRRLTGFEEELKAGLETRRRLAQAEQVIFSADEYRKQIPSVQKKLDEVAAKLNSDDYAQETRTQLVWLDTKVAALEYDGDTHHRMKEELAGLEEFDGLALVLRNTEETLPSDESNLAAIVEVIAAREKSIADSRRSIAELSKSLEELEGVAKEMSGVSSELAVLRESDRHLTGRIATLENALARCKELRAEMGEMRKALEKAKQDKSAYSDLAAAFGKKGVQALIIENAIPEIQEEANRLLARMTDNAMQVSIETVRDKKTGGTTETLDIRISDDMGTRSYELFSGGEAFRVNFALRIALSKLLARRAGARLQTLIIDEGFGTQDAKGREKLVEAISSIKGDFERILVITHIDELKDAFPTRIEITKDSQGSQISVD